MLFFEGGDLVVVGLFMFNCVRIKKQPVLRAVFLCNGGRINRES